MSPSSFFRRPSALALSLLAVLPAAAQEADTTPGDWFQQSPAATGQFPGASVDAAYARLAGRAPARRVVVAVIDGGVDVRHPALQGRLWTNAREIAGNGIDDDRNGYADDIHGWNFLGGPDGRSVGAETYEVTRVYARLRGTYEGKRESEVPEADRAEFRTFLTARQRYMEGRQEAMQQWPVVEQLYQRTSAAMAKIRTALGLAADATVTDADLARLPAVPELQAARQAVGQLAMYGLTFGDLTEYYEQLKVQVEVGYNADANERAIVGDDPADLTNRSYGNADVIGPDAMHGTHVAGIIAGGRSGFAQRGIAEAVEIMAIRAVPNGDERDKDVANAIRYAVDNGANIVNMSFGKSMSPEKSYVDEAVRYAASKNVLVVHAAGNDGEDIDTADNFPRARFLDGQVAPTWIEVGASNWEAGRTLAADFSNYGATTVDVFAPGVDIGSTLPEGRFGELDGTSMAAPVVSGVAALVWAYYPTLSAQELRGVILESSRRFATLRVTRPGGQTAVSWPSLSVTGGLLDADAALALAATRVAR